ncbi:plastid division protein [Actinidia rufa]|uniref:Plastid division protein n=1 Tax=Actinidia rufa TaxID=165716 RepID=A0A7J0FBQ3_9ERIC|nr:plastid division protein [Actinidia rufa]
MAFVVHLVSLPFPHSSETILFSLENTRGGGLNAADLRIVDSNNKNKNKNDNSDTQTRIIEIPVTCYQSVLQAFHVQNTIGLALLHQRGFNLQCTIILPHGQGSTTLGLHNFSFINFIFKSHPDVLQFILRVDDPSFELLRSLNLLRFHHNLSLCSYADTLSIQEKRSFLTKKHWNRETFPPGVESLTLRCRQEKFSKLPLNLGLLKAELQSGEANRGLTLLGLTFKVASEPTGSSPQTLVTSEGNSQPEVNSLFQFEGIEFSLSSSSSNYGGLTRSSKFFNPILKCALGPEIWSWKTVAHLQHLICCMPQHHHVSFSVDLGTYMSCFHELKWINRVSPHALLGQTITTEANILGTLTSSLGLIKVPDSLPLEACTLTGLREMFIRRHFTSDEDDTGVLCTSSNLRRTLTTAAAAGVKYDLQIVGIRDQAEKDEIVKSVMDLKNAEIEVGYTMDAVVSRQNLLMDVRDKLLFEPEYAGSIREKVPPKSSLRIPWSWLPGALCLLQEVGEENLVLDIGRAALQHPDAKPYVHDLLLSMALAECAIATVGFEKNDISQGFEALARSQCLLRSKISLGSMKLLSQIEESLEQLAPACTLELLGMPHTPEKAERRLGAIAALRELLRQGLDVEASCRVEDWPCFLSQALNKLMATEIVNLLSWDHLAVTRKNKKSLESQNQRVVIDLNCFCKALTAHIALGFSSKQMDLADEAEAVDRLQHLELYTDLASRDSILGKAVKDSPESNPSLANFFSGEKKASGNRQIRVSSQTMSSINTRRISPSLASDRRAFGEPLSYTNSSRHLGPAVKQLAPSNLQGTTLIAGKGNNESNDSVPSDQLKRNLGAHHDNIWNSWLESCNGVGRIAFVMALGCILFATFKLSALQLGRGRSSARWASGKPGIDTSSHAWIVDSSLDRSLGRACIKGNSIAYKLKNLLSMFRMQLGNHLDAANLQNPYLATSLSSSVMTVRKRPMPVEEAESLVKQWQAIKAEALGPTHMIHSLFQLLDGPMLVQWQALAEKAKTRSCFWRFVLLQLSVIRAEILSDEIGTEMAEIEVLLEEAAELVDESQLKNPNYYSTYTIRYVLKRQDNDSWRFWEGNIQTP